MNCFHQNNKTRRILAGLALPVYLLGVAYFTLLWKTGGFTGSYDLHLNLIPFFWIIEPIMTGKDFYLEQVILNVLLFVPLGVLLPMLIPACDKMMIFRTALGMTLAIEWIQPFFGRFTDIDDVLLNVTGALVGYALVHLAAGFAAKLKIAGRAVPPTSAAACV
ncbi:MAG: VanZ family protein [Clostridiales bacterium]|nr:VanZ family protein [Clostridiales bacterium]